MEIGNIVEYIDRQRITCAVILEVKKQRLRLLTENNREVNLSASRLLHRDNARLDLSQGRDKTVVTLKELANKRKSLIGHVDIKDLWEVLNTEQEWIDLPTMTEFCFPNSPSDDHQSAVIRAFFNDRLYFKFNPTGFFPNSQEQVERLTAHNKEAQRKERLIDVGGNLLKTIIDQSQSIVSHNLSDEQKEVIEILRAFYLFEKESNEHALAKAMLAKAGIDSVDGVFQILVKLDVFDEDENIDLHRFDLETDFPEPVMENASRLVESSQIISTDDQRKDLTALPIMTIDGQGTLDFDDALSLEDHGDYYDLGVHIVDVGHFIQKGDLTDTEAQARGSSIYMPDHKISMLPSMLAEGLCSLKADEVRPAISTMIRIRPSGEIIHYEIIPSLINVKQQLTYYDVNIVADDKKEMVILRNIAEKFRKRRLDAGAVQISVPEINVWINDARDVTVSKINRESPGRMLVSELMIMANWLMAKFLAEHNMPAVFRSQPEPRERLYKGDEGSLFQNWMQRKLISRFVLNHQPEWHSGLGLEAYVTATSPIRKYFDLVTQRQVRAILGLEEPYSTEEIDKIIQALEIPMSQVARIQFARHRYWLLKYLEKRVGQKDEAIVLYKKRNSYQILLPEYMLECELPISSGIELKPEDYIQVTIQHVSARKDILSVFMG
ncbi:MAG: RNB domain-containing ribonuclease [Desulfobacterales bacterium]|nr:MAG: RNB domain-containing ribonuclease [Desulfobacterales bacterium]